MREYGFELALCAHLESPERVVSRQLGAHVHGRRIADTVVLEPGPGFDARASITSETIPGQAIEADVGVGRARERRTVFGDMRPERARALVEKAVEIGFFERERQGGHTNIRQTARYPEDWFNRLIGVENKPDLDRPGDLYSQLRRDVSLGVFDEVILATQSYVTGAHLNRLPEAVGVWRFDPEIGEREVVREPMPLDTTDGGVEIIEEQPGQTDIRIVDANVKRRTRRRLAERVYGKGWRPDTLPACARCAPAADSRDVTLPYCAWKGHIVEPAVECGPECAGYEAADPPAYEPATERDDRTAWEQNPVGRQRRQAGLDQFG